MIQVMIYGVVRLQTGVSHFETNVKTLHELKGIIPGITRKEAGDLVVLVNGKPAGKQHQFQDGDQVVLLAPAGGG